MIDHAIMSQLLYVQKSNHQSQTCECQNGHVQLIHSHVEAAFASTAELGSMYNKQRSGYRQYQVAPCCSF